MEARVRPKNKFSEKQYKSDQIKKKNESILKLEKQTNKQKTAVLNIGAYCLLTFYPAMGKLISQQLDIQKISYHILSESDSSPRQ